MVGKSWPSGISQWKICWKKEELKLKPMKMKMFNFLCKIATYCTFRSQKLLIMKIQLLF